MEVMDACLSAVGGASGEVASVQVYPDCMEHFPKLSRRVPSIVVEPSDGGEVESGELRWPPDDVSSDVKKGSAHMTGPVLPLKGAEPMVEEVLHSD